MWWHYLLVFVGALLVDVSPFPLPPAFTVMVLLQAIFDLEIWLVIMVGVAGSILGRYVLTLYIPKLSGRYSEEGEERGCSGNDVQERNRNEPKRAGTFAIVPGRLSNAPDPVAHRQ